MKKLICLLLLTTSFICCKDENKTSASDDVKEVKEAILNTAQDAVLEVSKEISTPKTIKQTKDELTAKGFKTQYLLNEKTKDTILMQQYFMAFLKEGPIRSQNEEELANLQNLHAEHLRKMYAMGYADLSGVFEDKSDFKGATIYNVPTLKMADSLANADPMVIGGQLIVEIHPWWVKKEGSLR